MARNFLLLSLLEEAHALDICEMRRQAYEIRSLPLLTRDDDYVRVYRLSKELIDQLETDLIPIIKPTLRQGDSGYAQRAYLMTPISNAEENPAEDYFNNLHSTARNSVERTIGVLKGRFRCLLVHRVLHYHPDLVAKIVIACSVLHNICNRAGLPTPTWTEAERSEESRVIAEVQRRQPADLTSQADLAAGPLRRQELVDRLWRSRRIQ